MCSFFNKIRLNCIYNKIFEKYPTNFLTLEQDLENKFRELGNSMAANGMLHSGRHAEQAKEVFLLNIESIFNLGLNRIFSFVKDNNISLKSKEIKHVLEKLTYLPVTKSQTKLNEVVMMTTHRNVTHTNAIISEWGLPSQIETRLEKCLNEHEKTLLPLEANIIAAQSKNIARVAFLLSLLALVISTHKEIRFIFDKLSVFLNQ